jgi:hypothetical protein
MPEQKAVTVAADGGGKTTAPMPFMQDGCFLCGHKIGEKDPRQFYATPGSSILMLAHTGCLNKFKANGEQWPEEAVPEEKPAPRVDDLGDVRRVVYGHARVTFTPYLLKLPCDDIIAEKGLKAVIPDLIVALRAVEEAL